jgi:hypothetical protein
MTVKASDFVAYMRDCGIKRVSFGQMQPMVFVDNGEGGGKPWIRGVIELELSDTIPAPPPAFETLDEEPEKPAGTCIALGCSEPGGWHFDTRYCGPHGRAAAGVKP